MLKSARIVLLLGLLLPLFLFASCENDEGGGTSPPPPIPQPVVDPDDSTRVLVPAGDCILGNTPDGWGNYALPAGENPVYVDSFYIDHHEVSNQQYADYLDSAITDSQVFWIAGDIYDAPASGHLLIQLTGEYSHISFIDSTVIFEPDSGFEQMPVVMVSWYGATAFAEYYGKRLPTEAEWEKAARGTSDYYGSIEGVGVGYIYPWGNDEPSGDFANFQDVTGAPESVDSYPLGMSWFGAFNMAGNVSEWTATEVGNTRVHRGGSFVSQPEFLRTAVRALADPITTHRTIGFRCAADQ